MEEVVHDFEELFDCLELPVLWFYAGIQFNQARKYSGCESPNLVSNCRIRACPHDEKEVSAIIINKQLLSKLSYN
jgi:hypothetical protein